MDQLDAKKARKLDNTAAKKRTAGAAKKRRYVYVHTCVIYISIVRVRTFGMDVYAYDNTAAKKRTAGAAKKRRCDSIP